jgi:hypothetical protein
MKLVLDPSALKNRAQRFGANGHATLMTEIHRIVLGELLVTIQPFAKGRAIRIDPGKRRFNRDKEEKDPQQQTSFVRIRAAHARRAAAAVDGPTLGVGGH